MLYYAAAQRQRNAWMADTADAVRMGYTGARTKDGAKALERMLAQLRGED